MKSLFPLLLLLGIIFPMAGRTQGTVSLKEHFDKMLEDYPTGYGNLEEGIDGCFLEVKGCFFLYQEPSANPDYSAATALFDDIQSFDDVAIQYSDLKALIDTLELKGIPLIHEGKYGGYDDILITHRWLLDEKNGLDPKYKGFGIQLTLMETQGKYNTVLGFGDF